MPKLLIIESGFQSAGRLRPSDNPAGRVCRALIMNADIQVSDIDKQEGTSVNATPVKLLKEELGLKKKKRTVVYNDLDHLAGT